MTDDIVKGLKAIGCKIVHTQVNAGGRMVHLIVSRDGWDVAMFSTDASDLVAGRVTIDQIIAANKGADLADPWPRLADLDVAP